MIKTVQMLNNTSRTFNGIKPGKMVNVDVANVDFYKNNDFIEVTEAIETANAQAEAEAQEVQETEAQEVQETEAQQEAQAELDAEHAEAQPDAESDADALAEELANTPAPKKTGGAKKGK